CILPIFLFLAKDPLKSILYRRRVDVYLSVFGNVVFAQCVYHPDIVSCADQRIETDAFKVPVLLYVKLIAVLLCFCPFRWRWVGINAGLLVCFRVIKQDRCIRIERQWLYFVLES